MEGLPPVPFRLGRAVVVRPARAADVERILEIHLVAFPDPRSVEVRRRVFLQNRLGGLGELRVAEREGEIVGHAFSFPIVAFFGGQRVRGGAIASLGVAPEARGQGVATALLGAIHDEAMARGQVFTMLYPFRQSFYARHGYAPVSRHRVLEVSPAAVPIAWRTAAPGVTRRAQEGDRASLERLYAAAALAGTGFLERADRAWDHDLLDERRQWIVLVDEGLVRGYASFRLDQEEPHARVRAHVYELLAVDEPSRRRLFAAVAALGDQASDFTVALAEDDPLDWAFLDADRHRAGTFEVEHPQGVVNTGPMLRLLDPIAALLARGYEVDGRVELAVDGAAPFTLEVAAGRARVVDAGTQPIAVSSSALAAIAFGGLGVEAAARLGWLETASPEGLRLAGRLLRLPSFFTLDAF